MQKIKCLIIDDEPIAREIVKSYCDQFGKFEVVAMCESALKAFTILQDNEDIQLLFLDINLPKLDGLSFIKTLQFKPKIILTTAYKEYAIEAFELQVSDYLLKPFSFDRFVSAVQKVISEIKETKYEQVIVSIQTDDFNGIFLKIGKIIYRYTFEKIIFLEAQQNYTRVVTLEDDVKVYQPLSKIEEKMPMQFVRCHRSFIVNKNYISKIDGNTITLGKHEVTISPNQRDLFLEKIGLK
jgi:DNA-binding LytR/AlgR family response regulator